MCRGDSDMKKINLVPIVEKRPTVIWKTPCGKCPSAHGLGDPESEQILEWCRLGQMSFEEATFTCAWRGKKLCKGVCDNVREAIAFETV